MARTERARSVPADALFENRPVIVLHARSRGDRRLIACTTRQWVPTPDAGKYPAVPRVTCSACMLAISRPDVLAVLLAERWL